MIVWKNATIKIRTAVLLQEISLEISKGEVLGITGQNGSGKTTLARAISGELPISGDVITNGNFIKKRFVPFHSSLSLSNGHAVYRQQRWNKIDTELLPKVSDVIAGGEYPELALELLHQFGMENFVESFMINLSNGEQRKLELVKALAKKPDLLVLDNAYTGLDTASRRILSEMLEKLGDAGQTMVITGLTADDFPSSVNRFLVLNDGRIEKFCTSEELQSPKEIQFNFGGEIPHWPSSSFEELISMQNVSLQYGEKKILDNISWIVKACEKWSLTGPNGSGKTSLLNLIFGDNPKAYGCDIRLFGRQKGTGESIWDIKEKIGFISPEFHQYLPQNQTVTDVICSGFYESESAFKKPTGYQRDVTRRWLKLTGYETIENRLFGELSTSAQRVILFLRTLVKNPPLLILDEPFQGLDIKHVRMLKDLLNLIASQTNCAMIFVTHIPAELPECVNLHLKLKDGLAE